VVIECHYSGGVSVVTQSLSCHGDKLPFYVKQMSATIITAQRNVTVPRSSFRFQNSEFHYYVNVQQYVLSKLERPF
jgi:hypothetical protein